MEFWPHRRAKKQMPRIRSWPEVAEPGFLGAVAFKAGMSHVMMMDDSESPSKGTEVSRAVTILEMPKVYIYGMRLYGKKYLYAEPAAEAYDGSLAKRLGISKPSANLADLKSKAAEFTDVSALAFIDASNLGFGNKRVMRFEVHVGGKNTVDKAAFVEKWIGKEIRISDILGVGDYVDVISISKGKGWAGVIKRFGVARNTRKATGKIRHVGVLGPWHPAKVMFTVPHSGHMGYNYRTELNKRVLKIGTEKDAQSVNVKGGFLNYGVVKNDFIMLDGSIPGPSKRLIRFRKALRNTAPKKEPQVNYISVSAKN
ncbi:MAG: 50S ribosomal protein L3 [Candidatus Marsarchaeota archaeon]|nr:50S ribosomal protein L3 [Candidatus Marsarchaeota archaeon]MCL5412997.1 50S ribosomal protein L3 [Candidatus Marsarchaeota archaeon]